MGDVVHLDFRPKALHRDSETDLTRQADQGMISTIRAFCIAAERLLQESPMPPDVRKKAMKMQAIAADQPTH